VNKLGVISKERSQVRNSEAANLILIHRPATTSKKALKKLSFQVLVFSLDCY